MTPQDNKNLEEILERLKNLPEGETLPEDIIDNLTNDQLTAVYVEQMILDKGEEPNDALRGVLLEKLNEKVDRELINAIPDEYNERLEAALDSGNDEEVSKIIDESGIDVETITAEAMSAFRDKYLSLEVK